MSQLEHLKFAFFYSSKYLTFIDRFDTFVFYFIRYDLRQLQIVDQFFQFLYENINRPWMKIPCDYLISKENRNRIWEIIIFNECYFWQSNCLVCSHLKHFCFIDYINWLYVQLRFKHSLVLKIWKGHAFHRCMPIKFASIFFIVRTCYRYILNN